MTETPLPVREWSERNRKRPDQNLRNAAHQINTALKKAAVWEHRVPAKLLERIRDAQSTLRTAVEQIDESFPDPFPE